MHKQNQAMMPVIMRPDSTFSRRSTALLVCLIWASGLTASTQALAMHLDFAPELGPHWNHIYWPWRILEWNAAWYAARPDLFIGAGSVGVTLCSFLLIMLTLRLSMAANTATPNTFLHGSARWAEREDMEKASLFCDDGVYVGGWEDAHGKQHYLRHNGSEHILCIAPTRSGKGICLVVPTLLSWMQSCVITDLKGELWALTAGWRKEHGNSTVLRFEPAAASGSVGWNPLEEIRLGTEYETGDVQNLATMIVDPDGKGLRDHWQKTSQALLVGCILHLLYQRKNGDVAEASLPAVDAMLADSSRPLDDLWKEMVSYPHRDGKPIDTVTRSAQDMIDRPDEEKGSVLSTAKSYLALYRDDVVSNNVSRSGFRIRDLMNSEKPVSLYIVTQPVDKDRLRPLVRVMINMICRLLADKMEYADTPTRHFSLAEKCWRLLRGKSIAPVGGGRRGKGNYKYKLLMMLDEFPSLGKLGIVQESLAFLASYDIRFYLICQGMEQLLSEENGYGKDEAITSNCHIQNAFQPTKLDTAQHLSKLTGQTTIVKEQITVSGQRMGAMLGNVSRALQEVSRPLMTEDECLRMPPPEKDGEILVKGGDMLIYVAGFPAVYGKQMPYFLDPVFQARSSVNPPERSDVLIEAVHAVEL